MAAAQSRVNGFQQMRLARADRPVQDQGIGTLAGFLDHAQGRGMGHAITGADHEITQPMPAPRAFFVSRRDRRFRGLRRYRGWLLCRP